MGQLDLGFESSDRDESPFAAHEASGLIRRPTPDTASPRPHRPKRAVEAPLVLRSPEAALNHAKALTGRLAEAVGEPVRVAFTDNKRTMLSARRHEGRLNVRLHHMFLTADDTVISAVGAYLQRGDRRASKTIDQYIEVNRAVIDATRRRRVRIRTSGEHHELESLMNGLIERHFGGGFAGGKNDVRITWGRRVRGGRHRRSIQLGTYLPDDHLIRIHPVLDQAWVPRFYVEAVIFHELLHHDMGAEVHNGRRCFHTPAFRARERAFEWFAASQAWEKAHLTRLLRS